LQSGDPRKVKKNQEVQAVIKVNVRLKHSQKELGGGRGTNYADNHQKAKPYCQRKFKKGGRKGMRIVPGPE